MGRIVNFLTEVRKGVTKEEALKSIKHVTKQPRPRPQGANNFRRTDYSLKSAIKRRIGPKCVMKRWAQEGKINRKVLEVLEHHFCSSKIKPQQGQMMEWATEDGSTDAVPQIFPGQYLILGVFGSYMF